MPTKRIVPFKQVDQKPLAPYPDAVEQLKELLEMAEAGRIRALMAVGVLNTGESYTAMALEKVGHAVTMIGESVIMSAELQDLVLQTRYAVGEE